jgi:hypothetical protein
VVGWSFTAESGRGKLGWPHSHDLPPEAALDFPITDLRDDRACYAQLVEWLHPDGLACPRCRRDDRMLIHRRGRDPVLDFRCGHRHRVFNAFTGTALHGIRRRPRELVLIVRGFVQGGPLPDWPASWTATARSC